MSADIDVCVWCAVDSLDDDSVQLRECGHVLCDPCCDPCLECFAEREGVGE